MTAHILVPLDGTALAESALPLDVSLARLTSRGITLLRAVPTPAIDDVMLSAHRSTTADLLPQDSFHETWQEELTIARDYLDDIGSRLEKDGIEVQTKVVQDSPASAIVEYARENPGVSLIAITTRRSLPIRAWAYGSVVERVLHFAPKPVFLIEPVEDKETEEQLITELHLQTIIVPLDGSRLAEQALDEAKQLALLTGATLALVTVIPPADNSDIDQGEFVRLSANISRDYEMFRLARYLANTAEALRAEGLEVRTELVYGHTAEMILLTARRLHGDLIVIAVHGRKDLERMWLGSVAQKLVQSSTVPIVIIRTPELRREATAIEYQPGATSNIPVG